MELEPAYTCSLYAQYTIGLHAWFLEQVRQSNPALSAILHDEQTEKAFTLSGLEGPLVAKGKAFQVQAGERYRWTITALSKPVVQWMAQWLKTLPSTVELRNAPLHIRQVAIAHPATSYAKLWEAARSLSSTVSLSFVSPTSFRRHGHHFPLPVPYNLYHSYLRRWNLFSKIQVGPDEFLDWVDQSVLVLRHQLVSTKVVAGKKGAVTGFTGAIELGLSPKARADDQLVQLFYALSSLAPYCGTGHKTTFGLGQTRLGWQLTELPAIPSMQTLLVERIAELTALFTAQRKRTGGDRATNIAETWATILARREFGESLQVIADDLEIPYETVKTYAKRARQELHNHFLE
ncbi:CRISPR-associated endoribonuclease Cas6 [Leptolyngbya sp. 7M]|uniref:CRISPR-associated endoribonuclease Cas6 n=1 Tax=Leptolyngbya sp. 7M TaxID=2812896 RepID=UPI001B8B5174|nr:CRISPR-associated endoribonuclease Cas6 [Leptolyngbya sp. 7M]QYO67672.1 CRISPR-associated endoribonuclease Cas6 [Leptolyngbya sp. 7M]